MSLERAVLGVRTKSLTPVPEGGLAPDRAAAVYDRHALTCISRPS
jgi:hypothetical protein